MKVHRPGSLSVVLPTQHHAGDARVKAAAVLARAPRQTAEGEAAKSWHVAVKAMSLGQGLFRESPHGPTASAWSQSQGIAAALDLAKLTGNDARVDQMFTALDKYRLGNGYAPGIHPAKGTARFFDDNSWLGLDYVQAYAQTGKKGYLKNAETIFRFVETGQQRNGAVLWVEHAKSPTLNTCANGPAEELALRLYQATHHSAYLHFAKRVDSYMDHHLREPNGLYLDHVNVDGGRDPSVYSYNQGTPVGDKVLLYQITRDPKYLAEARQTAHAALNHFGSEGLWKQPPVFNAVFFRNLLKLDAVASNASYSRALKAYTARAWKEGRNAHGFFTSGGIGSYAKDSVFIDQAGMIQALALQNWSDPSLDQVG